MRIGVIIAMDKELVGIKSLLSDAVETELRGRRCVTGTLGHNTVVLHQCGIGKVNAAIGATELIAEYAPDAIISTGVAGGASTELNVQEVVVAAETCYHDVYCGAEISYGQVQGMPCRYAADPTLLSRAAALDCGVRTHTGLTVTGDWFVDSPVKMREIVGHFPKALAVDMESAAIAQACHLRGVPFLSFRIVSDIPLSDNHAQQYAGFWADMAANSFHVTKAFLESL